MPTSRDSAVRGLRQPETTLELRIHDTTTSATPSVGVRPVLVQSGGEQFTVQTRSVEGKSLSQADIEAALARLFTCPNSQEHTTVTATVADATRALRAAREYAFRLRETWPDAGVWARVDSTRPERADLLVVGNEWNGDAEDLAYDLMLLPEAEAMGIELDVTVYFESRCAPDTAGYSLI